MQLAAIEFARHKIGLARANSQEFDPTAPDQIIHLMEHQKTVSQKGGSMRLGSYPCRVKGRTKAQEAYGESMIGERHRHRYEFNNDYRQQFLEAGMTFSGVSPDDALVEIMELSDHAWFLGCQFHPELKSRPFKPHPLFREFVRACLAAKESRI
jgi:CTP synthase